MDKFFDRQKLLKKKYVIWIVFIKAIEFINKTLP